MESKLLRDAIKALHALSHPQNFMTSHNLTTLKRRDKAIRQAAKVLAAAAEVGLTMPDYDVTDMTTGATHKSLAAAISAKRCA